MSEKLTAANRHRTGTFRDSFGGKQWRIVYLIAAKPPESRGFVCLRSLREEGGKRARNFRSRWKEGGEESPVAALAEALAGVG